MPQIVPEMLTSFFSIFCEIDDLDVECLNVRLRLQYNLAIALDIDLQFLRKWSAQNSGIIGHAYECRFLRLHLLRLYLHAHVAAARRGAAAERAGRDVWVVVERDRLHADVAGGYKGLGGVLGDARDVGCCGAARVREA